MENPHIIVVGILFLFLHSHHILPSFCVFTYTAIPYMASTGPEQGFPCVVFPHRENPVFITGMGLHFAV